MKINRITITGDFAHFKIPAKSKIQLTYEIPPISTVVGILQNIYGLDIDDFILGYTINYDCKNREIMTIYKEIDLKERTLSDSKRFIKDLCTIEYLYNVELIIYTDICKEIELKDVLVLGKANCLAKIKSIEEIELIKEEGYGYNQYTQKNLGNGQIRRINTITFFDEFTDMYNIQSALVRENSRFNYDKNYDSDLQQNIYLWRYKGGFIDGI